MSSGYYTIASGVLANQKNINTISNNLVNSQTPGFRSERIVNSAFEMELMSRSDSSGNKVLGDGIGSSVTVVEDSQTIFGSGQIEQTGRNLDVAINGDGFYNVKGSDGNIYLTRNGSFSIDTEGYLVLQGLGRVQGQNGDISVKTSDITVSADGTVKNSTENVLGKILVTVPDDYSTIERTENGMFTSGTQLNVSNNYQLQQKQLELSNVDTNVELTTLIATQRAFQNCVTALKTIDTLDQKAASSIAAVG